MTRFSGNPVVMWPMGLALLVLSSACSEDGNGAFGGLFLQGDSVTVARADTARFCVALSTGGAAVAATQNDLRWDPSCLSLVDRCAIEPATGKDLLSNQRGPGDLRTIVISLEDTNPIPDGRLYCCSFRAGATTGCCPVDIVGTSASDPEGHLLTTGASNGEVCVQ